MIGVLNWICVVAFAHVAPSHFTYGVTWMPMHADWFVSVSGSDGNGGTSWDDAFATIEKASNVAGPGDAIAVGPGRYVGTVETAVSRSPDARVVFFSATPGGATIDGTGRSSAWRNHGSYVDIVGFQITGSDFHGIVSYGSHVRIIGNEVYDLVVPSCNEPNGGAGILLSNYSAEGNETIANVVYDIVAQGGDCNLLHGIYHANRGGAIQNNIVFNISATCVHTWHGATAVTITNNLVFDCVNAGIIVTGDDQIGDEYLVANNIAMHSRIGIREQGRVGTNNRFLNNLVYENGTDYLLENGSVSGSITAAPGFVDFQRDGSGDYRLTSGSPAIDAGVEDGAPATDIDGVSRPKLDAIDIGPYEARQLR